MMIWDYLCIALAVVGGLFVGIKYFILDDDTFLILKLNISMILILFSGFIFWVVNMTFIGFFVLLISYPVQQSSEIKALKEKEMYLNESVIEKDRYDYHIINKESNLKIPIGKTIVKYGNIEKIEHYIPTYSEEWKNKVFLCKDDYYILTLSKDKK